MVILQSLWRNEDTGTSTNVFVRMNEKDGAEEALNLNGNPGNPVNKTKTTIKRIFSEKGSIQQDDGWCSWWMDKVGIENQLEIILATNQNYKFLFVFALFKIPKIPRICYPFHQEICVLCPWFLCCISSLPVLSFYTMLWLDIYVGTGWGSQVDEYSQYISTFLRS